MRKRIGWALIVGASGLWACGESAGGDPTYYQDVRPILEGRCTNCHREGGIAPFRLDSYDVAKATSAAIRAAVVERRMPPWLADDADVSYRDDPSLTDEQIATISAWADAEAPEGDAEDPAPVLEPVGVGMKRVDLEVPMPIAYAPQNTPDDYHCFSIPWEASTDQFVTGFNAIPGNPEIVHHIAVYLIPPEYVSDLEAWDAAEDGPGYTCFGGPSGEKSSNIPTLLLSAWIPGYGGVSFPEGIGIRVRPGSRLALQVHYNVPSANPEPDQSKLLFQLADSVDRPAVYAPFLDVGWVIGNMEIPAGEASVEHSVTGDPRQLFSLFIQDLDFSNGFDIHAALFHMHKLGQVGTVDLLEPGEPNPTRVLNIPDWDFDWQQEYYLEQPLAFEPGDQMKLSCRFDNTAANQPCFNGTCKEPADVNWGEGSDEEMCVVNMLISPR